MESLKQLTEKLNNIFNNSLNTITTKLLMLFLFMTIIPLIVLAQFSTDLIKSNMNTRAKSELSLNSRVAQTQYKEGLKSLKSLVVQGMSTQIEEAYFDYKKTNTLHVLRNKLKNISNKGDLSFLFILNRNNEIIASANSSNSGEKLNSFKDLVNRVLLSNQPTASNEIFLTEDLRKDGSELVKNAEVKIEGKDENVIAGLSQVVALPIIDETQNTEAIVITGNLVAKNNAIADAVKELTGATFMISQLFENKETVIIATNLTNNEGSRAIGKIVPPEIVSEVVAFNTSILRDWQIREWQVREYQLAIYNPLLDSAGNIIGMTYVGIPEKQFTILAEQNITLISWISVLGLFCAILLSSIFSRTITSPILKLADGAKKISTGDLSVRVYVKGSTEITQMGETFNNMAESLQREEQLRDDFVATLTHDLKVPLLAENRIIHYLIDKRYGSINDEQQEVLDEIKNTNSGTLEMVNTLLEVYRYDAGKNILLKSELDIRDLVNNSVKQIMPLTEDKKLNVSLSMPEMNTLVNIDEREIKRVIHNLLSNAIACSLKRGSIRITISNFKDKKLYAPEDKDFQHTTLSKEIDIDNHVIISIYDTGIGMDEEEISNLFKRFSGNKGRKPSSIGLGLYYSQQVISAHKGHIWAESQEGEGSVFKLTLPIKS
ncbi:MAG: ATP-binding protein [Cyanobacteriota bacterium]